MEPSSLFELTSERDTLLIKPLLDMGEFNCDQIKQAGAALLAEVDSRTERNLIVDFSQTCYFGSDALGLFVHLWKKAGQRGGRIAFCSANSVGEDILRRAKFDHLGPICATRDQALDELAKPPG